MHIIVQDGCAKCIDDKLEAPRVNILLHTMLVDKKHHLISKFA